MTGVVTLGETMGVLRADDVGPLRAEHAFRLGIGGAESNVAIGVARLGVDATWIGRVGDDDIGRLVQRELRAEGVSTHVVVDPERPTGLLLKHRPRDATTRVVYYRSRSAGSRLEPDDLPAAAIAGSAILHVTGITPGLSATAARAVHHAMDIAARHGVRVSFDVNHRASLWAGRDAGAVYRELVSRADIVFAGADEAPTVVGPGTPLELARRLAASGPSDVLVKLGARGCLALVDGEVVEVPARRVVPVDTVGAGDAFVAGYLAEVIAARPLTERLDTAVRAGAAACLGAGDWESLPRRSDLGDEDRDEPVLR